MKHIIYIFSFLVLSNSCSNITKSEIQSFSKIDENYLRAFDTFYNYIETLNKNELSEEKIGELFNENFSMSLGTPNLFLDSISQIKNIYNSIRNENYPSICSPYEFNELKLFKLSYQPLTKNSVNIALMDVFLCSEKKIPSYKMSFIYQLIYDEFKGTWLLNRLTEVDTNNYPLEWNQVEIRESFKYNGIRKIDEIKPLLASELRLERDNLN